MQAASTGKRYNNAYFSRPLLILTAVYVVIAKDTKVTIPAVLTNQSGSEIMNILMSKHSKERSVSEAKIHKPLFMQ